MANDHDDREAPAEALDPNELQVKIAAHVGPDGRFNPRPSPAVLITHVPTGLAALCDAHPTQIANHREALATLTAQVLAARARTRS